MTRADEARAVEVPAVEVPAGAAARSSAPRGHAREAPRREAPRPPATRLPAPSRPTPSRITPPGPRGSMRRRRALLFAGLGVALVAVVIVSAATGQLSIPPDQVLGSILHGLGIDAGPLPTSPVGQEALWSIRFPRIALAMVVGADQRAQQGSQIASLKTQLQATPQIKYVAVLADGKADPSMLVTFDARNNKLLLQRVGGYQEASDKSLQLWALPPSGGPRSLGVLGSDQLLRLTAGEGDVRAVPALAITLEPKGGVPAGSGPTGPVLFKGALIQNML